MFTIKGKYTNATIHTDNCEQSAVSQIYDMCNHPVFKDAIIHIMPDVHAGAGCVIGTTVLAKEKKIVPSIVGVDIGCGVMATVFHLDSEPDYKLLDDFIRTNIPSGHDVRNEAHPLLSEEAKIAVQEIVKNTNFSSIDPFVLAIGSLGGGNHFIELDRYGNDYVLLVHTGSRNLGHKVCSYFTRLANKNIKRGVDYKNKMSQLVQKLKEAGKENEISQEIQRFNDSYEGIKVPADMAYVEGKEYDAYVENMLRCQKIAAESRRLISHDILQFLGGQIIESFDTIHNYIEDTKDGIVIRKGAISAKTGERVCIPLNMKDGCIIGIGKGNDDWNQSAPHGAGRQFSRSAAKEQLSMSDYKNVMDNVHTWSVVEDTLDESPMAYKAKEEILEVISETLSDVKVYSTVYNFKSS